MSDHIQFIRNNVNDVAPDERAGYAKALTDLYEVSKAVPAFGQYMEEEVRDLIYKLAKAKSIPVNLGR